MKSQSRAFEILLAGVLVGIMLLAGCADDPVETSVGNIFDIDYDVILGTTAVADSVLVLYVMGPSARRPVAASGMESLNSAIEDSVHITLGVLGKMGSPDYKAEVACTWRGDTLKIWCSLLTLEESGFPPTSSKNTPEPVWIQADSIAVEVPEGVGVRFLEPRHYWLVGW